MKDIVCKDNKTIISNGFIRFLIMLEKVVKFDIIKLLRNKGGIIL